MRMPRREFLRTSAMALLYPLHFGIYAAQNSSSYSGPSIEEMVKDLFRKADSKPGRKMIELEMPYTDGNEPGFLRLEVYPAANRLMMLRKRPGEEVKFLKARSPENKAEKLAFGANNEDKYDDGVSLYEGLQIKTDHQKAFDIYLKALYGYVLQQNIPQQPEKQKKAPNK